MWRDSFRNKVHNVQRYFRIKINKRLHCINENILLKNNLQNNRLFQSRSWTMEFITFAIQIFHFIIGSLGKYLHPTLLPLLIILFVLCVERNLFLQTYSDAFMLCANSHKKVIYWFRLYVKRLKFECAFIQYEKKRIENFFIRGILFKFSSIFCFVSFVYIVSSETNCKRVEKKYGL